MSIHAWAGDGVIKQEKWSKLTGSVIGLLAALAIGLLDGEAATKRTGDSSVTAADSADVSRGSTNAVELVRHLHVDLEVLLLLLGQTKGTGDIVGDLERRESSLGVASLVHVALERSSTIGIDLVNGDSHHRSRTDGSHATSSQLVLRLLANVNVAVDLGAATGVDNVLRNLRVTDDGGILLARRDGGAVTRNVGVDEETLTGALVTDGGEDGCVRVHSGNEGG
jgi:hypothetical protein